MRSPRFALILAAAALLPGCVAAAAAAGAAAAYGYVRYSDNDAYRDFRANADDTFDAATSVLRQNGHRVPEKTRYGDVRGELTVDDVTLKVTPNSAISTRVVVTVGTFSNTAHKDRAAAILQGIAVRLGE